MIILDSSSLTRPTAVKGLTRYQRRLVAFCHNKGPLSRRQPYYSSHALNNTNTHTLARLTITTTSLLASKRLRVGTSLLVLELQPTRDLPPK